MKFDIALSELAQKQIKDAIDYYQSLEGIVKDIRRTLYNLYYTLL
jgi:fructosamine-3-kinase